MTAAAAVHVRVSVTDTWDTVSFDVPPETTIAELKARALERALVRADPAAYVVKFRGARILDEERTVSALGLPDGAALIVLPARRRPVR
jgi:hypothetical protein